jgi:hypothetical protein
MTLAAALALLADLVKILASDGGLAWFNRTFGENTPNSPAAIAAAAIALAAPKPEEPTP